MGSAIIQSDNKALQIRLEQVRLLYRPTVIVAIGYALAASTLAFFQSAVIDHQVIIIWLACMGLVITGRVLSFAAFQRANPSLHDIKRWEQLFLVGAIAGGFVWGCAGIWLFPKNNFEYQVITLITLAGLSAGAVTTLSGLRKPIFIFLLLVMIPVIIRIILEFSDAATALGSIMMIYIIFLASSAHESYKSHLQNITLRIESINSEKLARKIEQKLIQTERIAHLGGWEWNLETGEMYWSDETYRIFGLKPEDTEPSYEQYIEHIHLDDRETVEESIQRTVKDHAPFQINHRIILPDASECVVHEEGEVLLNAEGKAVRISAIIHDISERYKLEEQLQQSQKMEAIGTLVGGIAHDFNNILAGMMGNLYLAKKHTQEADVQIKLTKVEQLASRASNLIKQMMTFARKDRVVMKPLFLEPFAKEVLGFLRSSIPENIELLQLVSHDSLQINGDETQLHQVLMNLVNNARDAVEGVDKPSIVVKLEACNIDDTFIEKHPYFKADTYAHLSVKDNGCGIPKHQLSHLFEPFFTTKEQGKGTGLGLSMSFGAIKTHHGYIEIESVEGEGSTFHIYIPLLEGQKIVSTPLPHQHMKQGQSELILLVDDELQILETGSEVLKSLGYRVLEASNGMQAVDIFAANKDEVALVIMDIVMPVLGGVKAAERIKEITPDTKVIFSTGYDMGATFPDVLPSNKAVVLNKPYNVNEINEIIRKMLDS